MNKKPVLPDIEKDCFTCPHCGVAAAFSRINLSKSVGESAYSARQYAARMGIIAANKLAEDASEFANVFSSLTRGIAVFVCQCAKKERLIWLGDDLIYPSLTAAPSAADDMPPAVRDIYDEATKVSAASPRAAAALLRLAFESLLKAIWQESHVQDALDGKGGNGENLALGNRVKLLYDAHLLSPSAHKMAKTVHLVGNEASHVPGLIQAEEEKELVFLLFQFLNLLVDELITRPQQAMAAANEAEKRKLKKAV